jgi:uncharacterized membrane protein YfcA
MSFTIYLIIGAFSGTLAGLLGLGGGVIVVPALATAFLSMHLVPPNQIMQMAVGTSLATIVITFISSLRAHMQRGSVRWDLAKSLIPGLIVGAIIGAMVAKSLPSNFLKIFFSLFLFFCAYNLFKGQLAKPGSKFPATPILFIITTIIGILCSILGAGGGVVLIPFMIRCGINMREATGTSVACGIVVSLVGCIFFMYFGRTLNLNIPWSTGFIYWPAFLGIALSSVLFAPIGTAIAYRLPTDLLKRILAIFLVLVGIDMLLPLIKAFL